MRLEPWEEEDQTESQSQDDEIKRDRGLFKYAMRSVLGGILLAVVLVLILPGLP